MRKIFITLLILALNFIIAQTPNIKTFNWKDAGFKGIKPSYTQTVNIMNFGGNNTNSLANNTALTNAIAALNNKGGVVYFPKGVYSFTGHLSGVLNNCINIYGTQVNTDTTSFSSPGVRDSNWVNVLNPAIFAVGQWVYLQCTDNAYMASSWAYGSLGQIMQIKSIAGNKLTFNSPFRFYYKLALQPKLKKNKSA